MGELNKNLMERLRDISGLNVGDDRLVEGKGIEKERKASLRDKIFNFFEKTPYPDDKKLHKFADSIGVDEHEVEGEVYAILSSILSEGFSNKGKKDVKYDDEQIKMGIEVEMEHTTDKYIAEKIAKDHLHEIPIYYTLLKKMESDYEKKSG